MFIPHIQIDVNDSDVSCSDKLFGMDVLPTADEVCYAAWSM